MFGGKGLGGGSGGNVVRAVGRAVTRTGAGVSNGGFQETFSSSSSSTCPSSPTSRAAGKPSSSPQICLSSVSSSPFSSPITSPVAGWPALNQCDDSDWTKVDDFEDENSNKGFDDFVFGPVPSVDEVQTAVSAVHQFFDSVSSHSQSQLQLRKNNVPADGEKDGPDQITSPMVLKHRASSAESGPDWIEPSADLYNSRIRQIAGADQVYDAFHLLRTDPSIQRMVVALSSDPAVWDAVLNNEVVHELRRTSADLGEGDQIGNSDESNTSNGAMKVVRWIMSGAKMRFGEVLEKIMEAVKQMFRPGMENRMEDPFQEKIRASFLLSVLVLLVVVVGRASRA